MIELTEKQIKEIASELECDLKVYFNLKTGEIKSFPNFDNFLGDTEVWEEELEDLEEHRLDYIEFERLTSRDSYLIMEDFADTVHDSNLQDKLWEALSRSKPFRNFNRIIDYAGAYRDKWFKFREAKYIEWVKEQLEDINGIDEFKEISNE